MAMKPRCLCGHDFEAHMGSRAIDPLGKTNCCQNHVEWDEAHLIGTIVVCECREYRPGQGVLL